MLSTVFVGTCIWSEFSCKENLLTFLKKVPRDDLLVLFELLLEDDAAEEASVLVILLCHLVFLHTLSAFPHSEGLMLTQSPL